MVITIDGPSGSGKSSLSKRMAKAVSFEVLDTGAMYRCVAMLYTELNKDISDPQFQQAVQEMDIQFQASSVFLNGKDVSLMIRTPKIDMLTSKTVSVDSFVRAEMCNLQRKIGNNSNIVAEGRDMGSHVFPQAELKFYLTASAKVRADRRFAQLQEKGLDASYDQILQEIEERDIQDSSREINPLRVPEGAIQIDTSDMSEDAVFELLLHYFNDYKEKSKI